MRRTHLLVALFLTPWITMYALSTFVMHHRELLTGHRNRVAPDFDVVREGPYDLTPIADEPPADTARRILADVGVSGAHTVRADANSGQLTIDRHRAVGSYRVTYDSDAKSLKVEKQRFGLAFVLEMLHRRRGFNGAYLANDLWAVSVDLVIVAIVLWAVTGIWMWLGLPRTRRFGGLCLAVGSALFLFFLVIL